MKAALEYLIGLKKPFTACNQPEVYLAQRSLLTCKRLFPNKLNVPNLAARKLRGIGPPPLPEAGRLAEPAFKLYDTVEYRWSVGGPFIGEARVIEVLADGRYRLERLNSTPFPKDGSIFGEEHLRLKPPMPVGSA